MDFTNYSVERQSHLTNYVLVLNSTRSTSTLLPVECDEEDYFLWDSFIVSLTCGGGQTHLRLQMSKLFIMFARLKEKALLRITIQMNPNIMALV